MQEIITGVTSIGLLGVAIALYNVADGRVKAISKCIDEKVSKSTCHEVQTMFKDSITSLEKHIDKRIDDLKDFIKTNGS